MNNMVQPESVILIGAFIWGLAGVATSLPKNRFDSGYPLTFFVVAIIGGLIGITERAPPVIDEALTIVAAVLFLVSPVGIVVYLFWRTPPEDDGNDAANEDDINDDGDTQPRSDGGEDEPNAVYVDGRKIRKPFMTRGSSPYENDADNEESEDGP